ncbi:hypothetical protein BN871_GC_00010, partial [Paenibacillus sp. P22]
MQRRLPAPPAADTAPRMGLFETFRTYGGEPYLLERHLRRLEDGCARLQISYRAEPDRIR